MDAWLVALAIVVGFLLLLLLLPVEVAFQIDASEGLRGQLKVRWLLGLVRLHKRFAGDRGRRRGPEGAPEPARKRGRARSRRGPAALLAALRESAFRQRVRRFAGDLLAAAHLRQFRLRARLGLGDPADTGCLWALVGPLSAWARTLRAADVRIDPDFADAVFEMQTEGRMRLIPLQLVLLAIGFVLSPPSIQAWRTLRAGHG